MESNGSRTSQTRLIILDSETDFEGWRKAARTLVHNGAKPSAVTWTVRGQESAQESAHEPAAFEPPVDTPLEAPRGTFKISARFVELARSAILHRDPRKFASLYRLLWRLRSHHDLLDIAADPDVSQIAAMAKAVLRDQNRMRASVRFREIGREQKAHYVAWYEPEHHIVEVTAPFFASRFADMPWSILTPYVCAHWDGHAVSITPGISKEEMPAEDRLEEIWRRHYAFIFNPARLKMKAAI
jgi:probable DNA metabolism protein